jgi:fluoroquinolone resistance protein
MKEKYSFENEKFSNLDYSKTEFVIADYINCEFISCNFSKTNISSSNFNDCIFTDCNMALIINKDTGFKGVEFLQSKLSGTIFSDCDDFMFSVKFKDCILDYSSFFKKKMKKTLFINCSIKEVDFEEADLTESCFDNSNLDDSSFRNSILEKVDFRKASNYIIDPNLNRIKKAKFSIFGIPGLLNKHDIIIEFGK